MSRVGSSILIGGRATAFSRSATVSPGDQGPPALALGHVVAAGAAFWEVYTQDVLNPAMRDVMARASAELPAGAGCKPLVVTVAPGAGPSATVTAVTDLHLDPAEALNIYVGATRARTCPTSPCSVRVPRAAASGASADVGAAGTAPFSTQAVVSANVSA